MAEFYTPNQDLATTKRLRELHAGNPAMQQRLAVDDRYWQGRGMAEDSPVGALGALIGSVPYDAAKLAYFHGPEPVRNGLEKLTASLFPGEGFNPQTTSRPALAQYRGYLGGMAEGLQGHLQEQLRGLTRKINERPAASARIQEFLFDDDQAHLGNAQLAKMVDSDSSPAQTREAIRGYARQQAASHALDPVGTTLKALNTLLQTARPELDTRSQYFEPWMQPGFGAIAPGMRPVERMTPERKAAQNAELSELMRSWGR